MLSSIDISAPEEVEGAGGMKEPSHMEVDLDEEEVLSEQATPQNAGQVSPPPLIDELADTQPVHVEEEEDQVEAEDLTLADIDLEGESETLHNLTYACVLIPRMPGHHLVGDLTMRLNHWVTQLSVAFGWRLEHLAIRPNYIHWIAVVPPQSSPGMMVYNLRLETSQRVFSDFPRIKRENPSGEFWAEDYLIVNGSTPLSGNIVKEFIQNVRSRQGVQ